MTKFPKIKRENFSFSKLNFPPGIINKHDDIFVAISDDHLKEFNFLCFLDSRGSTLNDDKSSSLGGLLINHLQLLHKSFVVICRPLELTDFFSLFNFLYLNDYKAQNLITNMGFVGFTPKKKIFIEDIKLQKALLFGSIECSVKNLEEYSLSDGTREVLAYLDMFPLAHSFSKNLSEQFENIYLMKTPEFKTGCNFPRQRPDCFYNQLIKTNMFLDKISRFSDRIKTVNVPTTHEMFNNNPSRFSYDGVHYTDLGHRFVFNRICESLENGKT